MERDPTEIQEMKELCRNIKDLIGDTNNRNVLSKRDLRRAFGLWKANPEMEDVLLTWFTKRPHWVNDFQHFQELDNCWAIALSRGITALRKLRGIRDNHPTPYDLMFFLGPRYLTTINGIINLRSAVARLNQSDYVTRMVVRERPHLDHYAQNEEFENSVITLLAQGPVPICFDSLPGYVDHQAGDGIYVPSHFDLQTRALERVIKHCVLLTGVGVKMVNGAATEFWEVRENFENSGFVRIARHMCIIRYAFEIEIETED